MPAEWHPQQAVWTAWPWDEELWTEDLLAAQEEFVAFVTSLSEASKRQALPLQIEVLVPDARQASLVAERLQAADVHLRSTPYGDIWLRDTGPTFLLDSEGRCGTVRFAFNGWGGRYLFDEDKSLGLRIEEFAAVPRASRVVSSLVAEGGAFESDGLGTLITTRQCLLNANRNPGLCEDAVAAKLETALGCDNVVWLNEGLRNDHTDGHVDTLARFVSPGRVACHVPLDGSDPNAAVMREIRASLVAARDSQGRRFEIIDIPSPGAVLARDGALLPASHLNFVMANGVLIVPVYGSDRDDAVLRAYSEACPSFKVLGLEARAILTGGGTFHCMTQQQPQGGAQP